MSAKELHYKRTQGGGQSLVSKMIVTSVLATLLAAFLINGATVLFAFSKMQVIVEQIDKRVHTLETELKVTGEGRHMLELSITKQGQQLDRMQTDLQEIKNDIRSFHRN